jgi:hypothetical protein
MMTTGAFVVFLIGMLVFCAFGLFMAANVKKQDDEQVAKKDKWAESEVDMISNKVEKV